QRPRARSAPCSAGRNVIGGHGPSSRKSAEQVPRRTTASRPREERDRRWPAYCSRSKPAPRPLIGEEPGRSRLGADTCIGVPAALCANAIESLASRPERARDRRRGWLALADAKR